MKLLVGITLCFISVWSIAQNGFVTRKEGQFFIDGNQYRYIGTNYWYGTYLALEKDEKKGIQRLKTELDLLKSYGLTNLRVIAGAEGLGRILGNYRVGPPLQIAKDVFDTAVLYGLDVLLDEMSKRDMKAVIFFSNNWEWSGGFLQYLNWNGVIHDTVLQKKMEWDDMKDNTSKFYICTPCKEGYLKQVELVLSRVNTVNGKRYTDDATIMSWQIANEPRPMKEQVFEPYKYWIAEVAAFIKSRDANHLVSIGHEGEIGTQSLKLFEEIHADKNIDYLTIHIWPKNWSWMKTETMKEDFKRVKSLTASYLYKHLKVAYHLKKPLVVEEFGFPRDDMQFGPSSSTSLRDNYYDYLFNAMTYFKNDNVYTRMLAGMNFWAFNGTARPVEGERYWKPGDDYMGDPPMEEQSLYGVFDSDSSTLKIIQKHTELLRKK